MTRVLRELQAASEELRAGALWYDDPDVGQRLMDAAREAQTLIADMPFAWPPVPEWDGEEVIRRKAVSGFPYGVIYYTTDTEIVIVAYAHERRQPGYWMSRL